jgi:hypothetical protein
VESQFTRNWYAGLVWISEFPHIVLFHMTLFAYGLFLPVEYPFKTCTKCDSCVGRIRSVIAFHVILQLFSRELAYNNEYDVVCSRHSHKHQRVWSDGCIRCLRAKNLILSTEHGRLDTAWSDGDPRRGHWHCCVAFGCVKLARPWE